MRRFGLAVAIIGVTLIVAAQFVLTRPSRFNPSRLPADAVSPDAVSPDAAWAVPALSAGPSTLTIPVQIPLSTVRAALEDAAPRRACGGEGGFFDVAWCFNRQDLDVSSRNDAIVVQSQIDGVVDPPFMSEISVRGTATMNARVGFGPEWRMVPSTTTSVEVADASYTPLLFETIDVGNVIEVPLRAAVAEQGRELEASVAADPTFERLARDVWDSLCDNVRLDSGADDYLQLRPRRATAAPATADGDYLHLQFGLDVDTRIGPAEGEAGGGTGGEIACPFPEALESAASTPGGFAIHLPTVVDYDVVRDAVAELVEEQARDEAERIRVNAVDVRPYAGALLATVELSVKLPGLLGGWSEGTLYVRARPEMTATPNTIRLSDIELDTESRHLVVAAWGEVIELSLRDDLEWAEFDIASLGAGTMGEPADLASMVNEWTTLAERELEARIGGEVDVTTTVNGMSVTDIAPGPEFVHAIGTLRGTLSVVLGSTEVAGH